MNKIPQKGGMRYSADSVILQKKLYIFAMNNLIRTIMKKTIFTLVIILTTIFFSGVLPAQTQNVDSLINVLNTQELKPDTQLLIYSKVCQQYILNDKERFKIYTDKGLELAQKEKNKKMLGVFNGYLGLFYYYQTSYDTAFTYLEKALESAIETGDRNFEANLYVNIALIYSMKGDFATEIEYDLKALSIYEKNDDKKNFVTLLVNIGTTYRSLREHSRALSYFDRAKKIADEIDFAHGKLLVAYAYASVYYDKGEYEKGLEYFLKSAEISKAENNKHFEILCLQSLATLYTEESSFKDIKKAEEYADESLQIANEFGDPFRVRGSLRALAYIYLDQKHYKDCLNLATQAWEIDSIDIDTSYDLAWMLTIANIHLGNKEKAEYFLHRYTDINGEKAKQNLQETLIGLEVKYETEKKESRITALEKERTLYIWLGIAGFAILLLAFALLFFRHRLNVQRRKLAEQQVKQLEQEKQIVAVQSVLEGETEERKRVAGELHDSLGAMLSVVKIGRAHV
jgi:tetratricopeptide (TPR) repeat protein